MSKRFWNGISVKIVFVFILFLVPVYILLFVSVKSYINSLQTMAVNSADKILEIHLNSLYAEMNSVDQFIYDMQETNTEYINLCEWKGTGMNYVSLYAVNKELIDRKASWQFVDALYVYVEQPDALMLVSVGYDRVEKHLLKNVIFENHLADHNLKWQIRNLDGKNYLVHTVGYYGVWAGVLIDMDVFMEQLNGQVGYGNTIVTVDAVKNPTCPDAYLMVSREVGYTSYSIHIAMEKAQISQAMPEIAKFVYILAFVALLLVPLLFFVFWRMIVLPIHRIEVGIRRLGEGQQDYRISDFKSANEFENLKTSFNAMAGEIQTLKIESYEKQLEKERMSLQNLLLQIRPHFLLNTFNQIFSMAQLKDFEGIQKMSVYLSKYFRYLFRSEYVSNIRMELDVVQNYLEMMEIRYLDCFTVTWDIDEALLDYPIPPLTIHNFVENIFKYAVCEGCETTIRIALKAEDGGAVVTIADDGPGMEEAVLARIRSLEPVEKKDGTHIGIWNCAYRLRTLCGEGANLTVESVLSEGTAVYIHIPARKALISE